MGRPVRSGAQAAFTVSIKPQVKTCPEEVGIGKLTLPTGARIVVLAHAFYPSHDRSLMTAVDKLLATEKPDAVILLGGMVHEDAFKVIADDEKNHFTKLTGVQMPPEITEILELDGLEERFLALAKKSGEFIAHFAEVSGAHVYYVPTLTGMLPNEIDIIRYVLEQKERADSFADQHPDEAKRGPAIPEDWAEFLGIHKNPNITVLPFGAAVVVNGQVRLQIGDFRRRNPGTAAKEDFRLTDTSLIRSFDGKVSSAWMTLPLDTLPQARKRYVQFHEVGHLFDITAGLGYLRKYDLRAQGILFGEVTEDGNLYAFTVPAVPGDDERRALSIYGRSYDEDQPGVRAKVFELPSPKRRQVRNPKASAKPTGRKTARK